jgi:hypothetical protein
MDLQICLYYKKVKKQSALCLVPPPPRGNLSVHALMRCAHGLRAVTRDVAAVTPQTRDDLRAGPNIFGFGWLLQALCFALFLLCI